MSNEEQEQVAANARLAVERLNELTDFEFGFDRRSVEWVDGFIERQRVRPDATKEFVTQLTGVLGSYLGECVAQATGGRWERTDEHGLGVELPNGTGTVFPFAKVGKQFDNGSEDSVLSFYDIAVDYIATGRLARQQPDH
jgi:hypothetical protein